MKFAFLVLSLAIAANAQESRLSDGSVATEDCKCQEDFAPVCGSDGKTYTNKCQAGCAKITEMKEGECPAKEQVDPTEAPETKAPADACVCPEDFAPVCGSDGNTYTNKCQAGCAKITEMKEGECPAKEQVDPTEAAVAATDGAIETRAPTDGAIETRAPTEAATNARCTDGTCKAMGDAPVCDISDRTTHYNKCFAVCNGVDEYREGACPEPVEQCDTTCEREIAPVCGSDGKTYLNKCDATCDKVERVTDGKCESTPVDGADAQTQEETGGTGDVLDVEAGFPVRVAPRPDVVRAQGSKCSVDELSEFTLGLDASQKILVSAEEFAATFASSVLLGVDGSGSGDDVFDVFDSSSATTVGSVGCAVVAALVATFA